MIKPKHYFVFLFLLILSACESCKKHEDKAKQQEQEKQQQQAKEQVVKQATQAPKIALAQFNVTVGRPIQITLVNLGDPVAEDGCQISVNDPKVPKLQIRTIVTGGNRTCAVFGDNTEFIGQVQYSIRASNQFGVNISFIIVNFQSNQEFPKLQIKSARYPLESDLFVKIDNFGGSVQRCRISKSSPNDGPQLRVRIADQTVDTCEIYGRVTGKIDRYYYDVVATNEKGVSNTTFELFVREKAPELEDAHLEIKPQQPFTILMQNSGSRIDQCRFIRNNQSETKPPLSVKVHQENNQTSCLVSGQVDQLDRITTYQVEAENIYQDKTSATLTLIPPGACQIDQIEYQAIRLDRVGELTVRPQKGPYGCQSVLFSIKKKDRLQLKNAQGEIVKLPKPNRFVKMMKNGVISVSNKTVSFRDSGDYIVAIKTDYQNQEITHNTIFRYELAKTTQANFRSFDRGESAYQSANKNITLQVKSYADEDIQFFDKKVRKNAVQGSDLSMLLNRKRDNLVRVDLNQAELLYQVKLDLKRTLNAPTSLLNINTTKNCTLYLPTKTNQHDSVVKPINANRLQISLKDNDDNQPHMATFYVQSKNPGACFSLVAAGKGASIIVDNLQFIH